MSNDMFPLLDDDDAETFNFQTANVLLIEQGAHGLDILMQIFSGFGTRNCYKTTSVDGAMDIARRSTLDLIILDPMLMGGDGLEFVRWLRRSGIDPNRSAPVVAISANGTKSAVARARDAGANFFMVKPVPPSALLDRIVHVAREMRPFIAAENYAGPDRRFKHEGPPPGMAPRRSTDLDPEIGDASSPNMSQDEIDSLLKPRKVTM